jgi:hypothetical protein
MRNNLNLPLSLARDSHIITQIARATFNLDPIVQEFLECSEIEDFV